MSTDKISKNKFVILSYEIFDDKSELVEKPDEPVNYIHGQTKKLLKKIEESIEGKTIGDMIDHIHTLTSCHLSLVVSNTLGTQVILTNLRVLDSVRILITFRGGMGFGRLRWGLMVVHGDLP